MATLSSPRHRNHTAMLALSRIRISTLPTLDERGWRMLQDLAGVRNGWTPSIPPGVLADGNTRSVSVSESLSRPSRCTFTGYDSPSNHMLFAKWSPKNSPDKIACARHDFSVIR